MNVIHEDLIRENHALSQYVSVMDDIPLFAVKLDLDLNVIWANKFAIDVDDKIIERKCFIGFNNNDEQCEFCPSARAIISKDVEVSLIEISDSGELDRVFEVTSIPMFGDHGILQGIFEVRKDVTLQLDYQKIKNEAKQSSKTKKKNELLELDSIMDITSTEMKEHIESSIKINDRLKASKLTHDQKIEVSTQKTALVKLDNIFRNIDVVRNINKGIFKSTKKKSDLKDIVLYKFNYYNDRTSVNGNTFDYKYDSKIPSRLIFDKTKLDLILANLIDYAMIHSSNRFINIIVSKQEETQDFMKISFVIKNVGSIAIHDLVKNERDDYFKKNLSLNVINSLASNMKGSFKLIPVSGYGVDLELELSLKKTFTASRFPMLSKLSLESKMIKKNLKKKKNYKILIVEDEAIGRITMEQMLKNDYDIVFAKNGKVGVEKYASESPDLVIMDIMMPIMNGFDAYDQIERNNIDRVPIIACTAKVINSEKEYLKSYGFDDYIAKPINMKVLKDIIKRYLP